jgi:hypothetical protein
MTIDLQIHTIDDLVEHGGMIRKDGHVQEPGEDFSMGDFLMDNDEAAKWVEEKKPGHLWTLVDAEGNDLLESGFHVVNRLGYVFSTLPPVASAFDAIRYPDGSVVLPWED